MYAFNEMQNNAPNPAENAGLRLGDVLVSVNGLQVLGNFHRVSGCTCLSPSLPFHAALCFSAYSCRCREVMNIPPLSRGLFPRESGPGIAFLPNGEHKRRDCGHALLRDRLPACRKVSKNAFTTRPGLVPSARNGRRINSTLGALAAQDATRACRA